MSKKIEVAKLSEVFDVRLLQEDDLWDVFHLCKNNELYYEYCPPQASLDGVRRDMNALPPGKGREDKFYIGFFEKEKLVAILDLIRDYPKEQTVFIGLFMMDVLRQGRGIGSKIIEEVCAYLKQAGFLAVRLAWVKQNPQAERFWIKNGFVPLVLNDANQTNIEAEVVVSERLL